MDIELNLYESRVIGSLIEKEITTPEQYPLSLNALTNACNQKSSREPVLELDEGTVQQTVDALVKRHLVREKTGFGSRVVKYQQRFCNTEFGALRFSGQELGIICVLLLRGPQTPGELRTRTNRLCRFNDVDEVEATLKNLMEREDGPFVTRLPRDAGRREVRYAHLFSGEVQPPAVAVSSATVQEGGDRLERLEAEVHELRQKVDEMYSTIERLTLGEGGPGES